MIRTSVPAPADQAAGIIWTTDHELRFTSLQGAALQATGSRSEELVGTSLFVLFQTDDPEAVPIRAHRRALTGESVSYEVQAWGRTWDCQVAPLRDANGTLAGTVGVALDRTAQRQAADKLQGSRHQYEELVNSLDGIVWEADAATVQFTFVSQQAERLLGYPVERWVTEPTFWQDHMHPDDRGWAIPFCAVATAEKRPHELEYRMIAADGRVVWLRDIVTVVMENDRAAKLRGVMVDITEKQTAEEALRESGTQLRLEQQVLEQRVEERTQELEVLLGLTRALASTLDSAQVVRLILDELKEVVPYNAASVILSEGDEVVVHDLIVPEKPGVAPQPTGVRFALEAAGPAATAVRHTPTALDYPCVQVATSPAFWERMSRGEAVIIPDVLTTPDPVATNYRTSMGDRLESAALDFIRTWMAVPLALKDRTIGYIGISSDQPGFFTEKHARLARAFADHAAVAIENARLYEQSHQLAALEERQRLARELHDSVSQALYGIALGSRTARTLLDRDPVQAAPPLDYVLSLAEAGLAEMRALIFELRPESLEAEGLVAALEKQAAALRARQQMTVETDLGEEPDAPLPAKEALYRIAQEALHNVVKHAQARSVTVHLTHNAGETRLEICDDGVGFDPTQPFPGHLGLRSMRERIERLQGSVALESAPGEGTRIEVRLPH